MLRSGLQRTSKFGAQLKLTLEKKTLRGDLVYKINFTVSGDLYQMALIVSIDTHNNMTNLRVLIVRKLFRSNIIPSIL